MTSARDFVAERFSLTGRIALVTGASSGIGRHLAGVLASAGAQVVAVARRREALEKLEQADRIAAHPTDLAAITNFDHFARAVSKPFGAPDILVNAAGINLREDAGKISRKSWDATININLSVPFFAARALAPAMVDKGGGNIINIASLQSFRAFANGMAYGASKGGLVQLTRAMAEAWSAQGIVANAIAPGFFPTELTAPVFDDEELAAAHAKATAVGRNGELADLDGAAIFLASRSASYVTGQVLAVDGGYLAT